MLHRLINGCCGTLSTKYLNGDRLDNRKENMIIVSRGDIFRENRRIYYKNSLESINMCNEYYIDGEYVLILINKKRDIWTKISIDRLEKVKMSAHIYSSFYDKRGNTYYCRGVIYHKGKVHHQTFIHRIITDCPLEMEVDHKNHDTLDNTSENLRVCDRSTNMLNIQKVSKNNTSGVRGVYLHHNNKWVASITKNKKREWLGIYLDIEDAIKARKEAEIRYETIPVLQKLIKRQEGEV